MGDYFMDLLKVVALGFVYDAFLTMCIHFQLQYRCIMRLSFLIIVFLLTTACVAICCNVFVTAVSFAILGWFMEEAVTYWLSSWRFGTCSSSVIWLKRLVLCISAISFVLVAKWLHLQLFFAVPVIMLITVACAEIWLKRGAMTSE